VFFIDVYQASNVIGKDSCDDAIAALSDTGRYHTTFIQPQHVDASRSTFNNVQGNQSNVVNVTVSHTVVDDSTSHSLVSNDECLQYRL
jgi:hypothetical protein